MFNCLAALLAFMLIFIVGYTANRQLDRECLEHSGRIVYAPTDVLHSCIKESE